MRKLLAIVGLIGALVSIEGLMRFGNFVGAFGAAFGTNTDYPFYVGFTIIYVIIAGLLLVSLFVEFRTGVARFFKYALLIFGLLCFGLMFAAPAVPVVFQVLSGFLVALIGLFAVRISRARDEHLHPTNSFENSAGLAVRGSSPPETQYAEVPPESNLDWKLIPLHHKEWFQLLLSIVLAPAGLFILLFNPTQFRDRDGKSKRRRLGAKVLFFVLIAGVWGLAIAQFIASSSVFDTPKFSESKEISQSNDESRIESSSAFILDQSALGLNKEYVSSKLGPPIRIFGDEWEYEIGSCRVWLRGEVSISSIAFQPNCPAKWNEIIPNWRGRVDTKGTTLGDFVTAAGVGVSVIDGCFKGCGNAADPVLTLGWTGSHADGFIEVILRITIGDEMDDVDAHIRQNYSELEYDELYDLSEIHHVDLDQWVMDAFQDVPIDGIEFGYSLFEQ